jgi:hypothetical protein
MMGALRPHQPKRINTFMAANGISTETAGDPANGIETKIKRRTDKLALAAAKRQSVGTPGFRTKNTIVGTHSAYVNGAGGANLQVISGTTSPTASRPWS